MMEDNDYYLPKEIDLLFDNKKLDILKYLGILYHSKKQQKKRKLNFDQLLYYYSMLHFETNNNHTPMIYKYLRDQKRINEILIYLDNLGFVEIHGDLTTQLKSLKVSITDAGIEIIESSYSESINKYLKHISTILDKYVYGTGMDEFKKILYKGDF